MLWVRSQKLGKTPSELVGLKLGSYEAWCLDEALWYLGSIIEGELEQAGHKPSKQERQATAARQKVLDKYLKPPEEKGTGFADPALFFQ